MVRFWDPGPIVGVPEVMILGTSGAPINQLATSVGPVTRQQSPRQAELDSDPACDESSKPRLEICERAPTSSVARTPLRLQMSTANSSLGILPRHCDNYRRL
jgi:hypothetical protein